jgi:hypothetical protein
MIGAIWYTDNRLDEKILRVCQEQIKKGFGGELITVSLKPVDFGQNIVLDLEPSYTTMVRQIITALEASTADYCFFLEHDVLYSPDHFKFVPTDDHTYYYNSNLWRWDYPHDRLIKYDGLTALSQMCVNRKFALDHYKLRLKMILEKEFDKITTREPAWARIWGYEPGTKKKRNGGFADERSDRWKSTTPNIDIRHKGTFSPPKVTLNSFKHLPSGWKERTMNQIEGWNKEFLTELL